MARSKRELLFEVNGMNRQGEKVSHLIYKEGRSFYVSGPDGRVHLCHPSVTNHEGILREIRIVFGTSVSSDS